MNKIRRLSLFYAANSTKSLTQINCLMEEISSIKQTLKKRNYDYELLKVEMKNMDNYNKYIIERRIKKLEDKVNSFIYENKNPK
jgi:hypothetical protein